MKNSRTAAAALTALAVGVGLVACSPPAEEEPSTLTLGVVAAAGSASSYNQFGPNAATYVIDALYDGLWDRDQLTGEVFGEVVEDWELDDEARTITATVRDGIEFTDGTPFTAENAVQNINYVLSAPGSFQANFVESAEVTGGDTFVMHTKQSGDEWLWLFYVGMGPAAFEDTEAPFGGSEADNPNMGSGPYTIDEENTTVDVEYTLLKKDDHWDADSYAYDTIVVKVFSDAVAALNALQSGQIDFTALDPSLAQAAEDEGFVLHTATGYHSGLYIGDFEGRIVPALGDVRVRQALSFAFDREAIVESIEFGLGIPSSQVFSDIWPEYIADRTDEYGYDPERARELLAEAGYPDGFDLPIPVTPGNPYRPVIEQSLADIGIRVQWQELVGFADLIGVDYVEKGWPVIVLSRWNIQNTLPAVLDDTALLNNWHYDDPTLNELIDITEQGSEEEAAQASQDIGNYLLDEAWFANFTLPLGVFAGIEGLDVAMKPITSENPSLKTFRPAG